MTNHEVFENAFLFDLDDDQCYSHSLADYAKLKEFSSFDMNEALKLSATYKKDDKANAALEKQAKRELKKWQKMYMEKVKKRAELEKQM